MKSHILGDYYTAAYWDGNELQQIERTMLPSTGTYKVVLEKSNFQLNTYILIDVTGQIQLLGLQELLPTDVFSIHCYRALKMALLMVL